MFKSSLRSNVWELTPANGSQSYIREGTTFWSSRGIRNTFCRSGMLQTIRDHYEKPSHYSGRDLLKEPERDCMAHVTSACIKNNVMATETLTKMSRVKATEIFLQS